MWSKSNILMVRPKNFAFNPQTAVNNYYQNKNVSIDSNAISKQAILEFDSMVQLLKSNGVNTIVFDDLPGLEVPDSVFPNNWVSFHNCGSVFLYPMFAENRRIERRLDILNSLKEDYLFDIKSIFDLTKSESKGHYLEGTGSMVLDRKNKICYAAISNRTEKKLVLDFCKKLSYLPVVFDAFQTVDDKRELIYHTNVMMCVADKYVVICMDSIDDPKQKEMLLTHFENTNKEIIEITENQVSNFAGNMLQVFGEQAFLVMSSTAYNSLNSDQIKRINAYNPILHTSLKTIEENGGGSARCMMSEVCLRKKA